MNLYTTLKQLCLTSSVSGREGKIRETIKEKISPFVDDISIDALGNLIALKKGNGEKKRKIMLCAHMDEIGFIVNFIEENGMVRVGTLGGIRLAAASYTVLVSENGVKGALCSNADVSVGDYKADTMYIDIGASSRREAERKVSVGDTFVCEPSLCRLSSSRVCGRPIDDRVGCLILLELAERLSKIDVYDDVYFVFSVQEEVGCRGSKPATFAIAPDIALCFDVTATGDTFGAKPMDCALSKGAAIKIKDSSVICSRVVINRMTELSEKHGIKHQYEVLTAGGTDTSSMQTACAGAYTGCISIPTRYIHTPVETVDTADLNACRDLLAAIIKEGF